MDCRICKTKSIPLFTANNTYKCGNCGHVYIDFKGDGLGYHKDEYRTKGHGTRVNNEINNGLFTQDFHNARKTICENRIKKIQNEIHDSNTMLDIGAGGGTFVKMLKDKIPSIECQEISEICINNLGKEGFVIYKGDFNDIKFDKKYDLVTCWHVLEHLKDLEGFVKNAINVTKKYLVIEVPINRRINDPNIGNWDGHYHYFSKDSLRLLFKESFDFIRLEEGVQSPALLAIMKKK
tara:strand:- start:1084 stop:1791 length:708 start_codon:yes stop_codon:yes gene_type:complete